MTSNDWDSLFEARHNLIEAANASELVNEFFSICPSHTDYMWDIQTESL